MKTYYEILGVKANAAPQEIKQSYLNLIYKYHPDIYEGDKDKAQKYCACINEAYSVLKDENKKREYNNYLKNAENADNAGSTQDASARKAPEQALWEGNIIPQQEARRFFKNTKRKRGRFFTKSRIMLGVFLLLFVGVIIFAFWNYVF